MGPLQTMSSTPWPDEELEIHPVAYTLDPKRLLLVPSSGVFDIALCVLNANNKGQ